MAFKPRSPESNARLQRVRGMSRALGSARITAFGEGGEGSERQDLRVDAVSTLAHGTSVPVSDVKGITAIHGASPELRRHFADPKESLASGAYDHKSGEVHLGGEVSPGSRISASALSHEVGHHVDTTSGRTGSQGPEDRGASEGRAVNYQHLHAPGWNSGQHYDSHLTGNDAMSYSRTRASGTLPGHPALGTQFN
jgi:hypothetical protein